MGWGSDDGNDDDFKFLIHWDLGRMDKEEPENGLYEHEK